MIRKPTPPESVTRWARDMRGPAPRCCHTCNYYDPEGRCRFFDQRPPDDFVGTLGACDEWEDEIPF